MNAYKRHMLAKRNARPTTIFDLMTRPIEDWGLFQAPSFEEPSLKIDLKDDGDHYELTADLPGVKKEDVKLSFEDGILTISAQIKREEENRDDSGYLFRERSFGTMQRRIALDDVDESKSEAIFENGVLKLNLAKAAKAQPKTIAIK